MEHIYRSDVLIATLESLVEALLSPQEGPPTQQYAIKQPLTRFY